MGNLKWQFGSAMSASFTPCRGRALGRIPSPSAGDDEVNKFIDLWAWRAGINYAAPARPCTRHGMTFIRIPLHSSQRQSAAPTREACETQCAIFCTHDRKPPANGPMIDRWEGVFFASFEEAERGALGGLRVCRQLVINLRHRFGNDLDDQPLASNSGAGWDGVKC